MVLAGPHMFFGKPMIVKPWAASFNFQEEILRVIPVWVRLPNLPLSCWGSDSLTRIGSLLGAPLLQMNVPLRNKESYLLNCSLRLTLLVSSLRLFRCRTLWEKLSVKLLSMSGYHHTTRLARLWAITELIVRGVLQDLSQPLCSRREL